MKRRELPLLAGIAGCIRWVEELVSLVSGPLLTLGLLVALTDLLTDGKLLTALPVLLFGWAISQAVGVDAQLVAAFDRAHIALRERRYWSLLGLLILGAVLCYVGWIAAVTFATQQSEGISEASALTRLGMDPRAWLIQRTALSVFLVALSGWQRYHSPDVDVAADADAERARLEADLMLEPLRAQKRVIQARGVRSVLASAMGKEATHTSEAAPAPSSERTAPSIAVPTAPSSPTPSRPPTGPGSPVIASKRRAPGRTQRHTATIVPLRSLSAEERIRRVVAEHPAISVRALARRAGVAESTASKHLRIIAAEQSNQAVQ